MNGISSSSSDVKYPANVRNKELDDERYSIREKEETEREKERVRVEM